MKYVYIIALTTLNVVSKHRFVLHKGIQGNEYYTIVLLFRRVSLTISGTGTVYPSATPEFTPGV